MADTPADTPAQDDAVLDAAAQSPLPEGPWRRDDEHDQRLIREVATVDHAVPTGSDRYHLVVIGGGSAGLVTSAAAAGLGAKVALIEKTGLGGDCLLSGCVPSKALLASARRAHAVRNAVHYGVHIAKGSKVDFAAVMQRLRRIRADLSPIDPAVGASLDGSALPATLDATLGSGGLVVSTGMSAGGFVSSALTAQQLEGTTAGWSALSGE